MSRDFHLSWFFPSHGLFFIPPHFTLPTTYVYTQNIHTCTTTQTDLHSLQLVTFFGQWLRIDDVHHHMAVPMCPHVAMYFVPRLPHKTLRDKQRHPEADIGPLALSFNDPMFPTQTRKTQENHCQCILSHARLARPKERKQRIWTLCVGGIHIQFPNRGGVAKSTSILSWFCIAKKTNK